MPVCGRDEVSAAPSLLRRAEKHLISSDRVRFNQTDVIRTLFTVPHISVSSGTPLTTQ